MLSPVIYLMMNGLFFTLRLSGGGGSFPRPLKAAEEKEYLEEHVPEGLKNGDVLRISQSILRSAVLWPQFITAEKIDEMPLEEFHASYKAGCPELDYEAVSRIPVGSDAEKQECSFSGKIFQVIEEGGDAREPVYLLRSGDNYVYVSYAREAENRDVRFLEGDSVTVYGDFTDMKTYDTLVGKNTVPQITAYLIDQN